MQIINCGAGNLGSLLNMLKYLGVEAKITNDYRELINASRIILPGVGAFDNAMNYLKSQNGIIDVLKEKALNECVPVLGICLGMQLLLDSSEEGVEPGLGLIGGSCEQFTFMDKDHNIPHMGWNKIKPIKDNALSNNFDEIMRFYFVHSYHCKPQNVDDIMYQTDYHSDFVSGINRNNIFGVQFHPEKSHKYGMKLLKNFSSL